MVTGTHGRQDMGHTHKATRYTEPRCYDGGVASPPYTDENQRAHGDITYREVCECGATRAVNANQGHFEYGTWNAPKRAAAKTVAYVTPTATPAPTFANPDGREEMVQV